MGDAGCNRESRVGLPGMARMTSRRAGSEGADMGEGVVGRGNSECKGREASVAGGEGREKATLNKGCGLTPHDREGTTGVSRGARAARVLKGAPWLRNGEE